jgi:hypothetical protein
MVVLAVPLPVDLAEKLGYDGCIEILATFRPLTRLVASLAAVRTVAARRGQIRYHVIWIIGIFW